MFLAIDVYSQESNKERANKITNEISKVLFLNDEEKIKVYEIQFNRFKEVSEIRSIYANDLETKKVKLKKVYNKLYGKLKSIIGKDKMKKWRNYKANK
jgi:hypothetical protein